MPGDKVHSCADSIRRVCVLTCVPALYYVLTDLLGELPADKGNVLGLYAFVYIYTV
jgi:hypothetical protein